MCEASTVCDRQVDSKTEESLHYLLGQADRANKYQIALTTSRKVRKWIADWVDCCILARA